MKSVKKKKKKVISVKQCVVEGSVGYGLTDGKNWFFYAYRTKNRAQGMIQHFDTPESIEVNISQPSAFKMID